MDPRIAWVPPEQLGKAHDQWTRHWEIVRNMHLNNNSPNVDQKPVEFIPLNYTNRLDQKQGPSNCQNNYHNQLLQKRKRDNKASTYGLNHSSNVRLLREDGGLTPWIPRGKIYSPEASSVVRYVILSTVTFM